MLELVLRFIPNPVKAQVRDRAVDLLVEAAPDDTWRKRLLALRSDGAFRLAFENSLERAVQRFAAEYDDPALVDALTQSTRFWDLPGVQRALREIVVRPSSYLVPERDILLQSFAEIVPDVPFERVERAVRFFMQCLAEEVINIPQLSELYHNQLLNALLKSHQSQTEYQKKLYELEIKREQERPALPENSAQSQLLLAAPADQSPPSPKPVGPKVYHNLPRPDYEVFVGREQEKAAIIERLSPKKQMYVISIDGVGGVGKSALALDVAYHFLNNAPTLPPEERFEAIVWTSAKQTVLTTDGIISRPQAQVLRCLDGIYTAISVTLGREDIRRARPEEQALLVSAALSERRTLLIIDNLETIDDDTIMDFLHELPYPTKAIVTTRHRINVAYPVRLTGLPEADALALIRHECEEKGVTLNEEEAQELFRRTGGLPLAIGWSIGLMGFNYPVKSVLARLGSPKSDIIKFSFQTSVDAIQGKDAYKLLLALSLFAKDASREALGYVAGFGEDELSRDMALADLERLSLANRKGGRFSLLPLTKTFASHKLDKDEQLKTELHEKWISFFFEFCRKERGTSYREINQLDVEIPNMLGFLDWCWINNRPDTLVNFLFNVTKLFWARGYWTELTYYLRLAYDKMGGREGTQVIVGKLAYELAGINYLRGELDSAESLLLQALDIFEELQDFQFVRRVSRNLVQVYTDSGGLEKARFFLEKAYQAAIVSDTSSRATFKLKRYHAPLEIVAGNFDLAAQLLEETINYYEGLNLPETSTFTMSHALLGRVEIYRQRYEVAQTELEHALDLAHRTEVKSDLAFVAQSIALLKEATGEKDEALTYASAALSLYKQLNMKVRIAETEQIIMHCR